MKATNWTVPLHKIKQFQEILGKNGGYFLSNPRMEKEQYRVDFEIDGPGIVDFQKQWRMVNTDIIEKPKRKNFFQQSMNNIKGFFLKLIYPCCWKTIRVESIYKDSVYIGEGYDQINTLDRKTRRKTTLVNENLS